MFEKTSIRTNYNLKNMKKRSDLLLNKVVQVSWGVVKTKTKKKLHLNKKKKNYNIYRD